MASGRSQDHPGNSGKMFNRSCAFIAHSVTYIEGYTRHNALTMHDADMICKAICIAIYIMPSVFLLVKQSTAEVILAIDCLVSDFSLL